MKKSDIKELERRVDLISNHIWNIKCLGSILEYGLEDNCNEIDCTTLSHILNKNINLAHKHINKLEVFVMKF